MGELNPFERLTGGPGYAGRMQARADAGFEEGKVKLLLGTFKFNVTRAANAIRRVEDEARGRPDLTFRAFAESHPSFPLVLGASRLGGIKLHIDPKSQLPALFKDFGSSPIMLAYETFYERASLWAGERIAGLVFPRKGLKNGLVVYTADAPDALPLCDREAMFCYAGGGKKDRHWIVVRSFQKVLDGIHNGGHGWRRTDN